MNAVLRAFAAAIAAIAPVALAAPGDLDPAYGTAGSALFTTGLAIDTLAASALLADGRIVSAGMTLRGGLREDVVLMRHSSDGTLDPSFGTAGRALHKMPGARVHLQVTDLHLQGDGKLIVAAGCTPTDSTANASVCIARFMPDGALDTTFADAGWFVGMPQYNEGIASAVRADGKILYSPGPSGGENFGSPPKTTVAQLTVDGAPDLSFGNGGEATLALDPGFHGVRAMRVQGDGKVVAIGPLPPADPHFVARLLPSGSPDPAFGAGGSGKVALGHRANDLALTPDGKVVVLECGAGPIDNGSATVYVQRLDAAGAPDPSFGSAGTTSFVHALGCAQRIAVHPAGEVTLTATAYVHSPLDDEYFHELIRLTASGSIDGAYGNAGTASVLTGSLAFGSRPLIQADGAVVTGTTIRDDFALVRVAAGGTADATFASGGIAIADSLGGRGGGISQARRAPDGGVALLFDYPPTIARITAGGTLDSAPTPEASWGGPSGFGYLSALSVQADGKLVGGGPHTDSSDHFDGVSIRRFDATGALDPTFAVNGERLIGAPEYVGVAEIIAQADGKIAIAGGKLARLDSSGGLDPTFGTGGIRDTGARALAIGADGKWTTSVGQSPSSRLGALRTQDGNDDAAFGNNGVFLGPEVPFLGLSMNGQRALPRADGGAILFAPFVDSHFAAANDCRSYAQVGSANRADTGSIEMVAVTPQGTIDTSFGAGGVVITRLGLDALAHSAVLDAAGRIVVSGVRRSSPSSCEYRTFVARFTPQGVLDPTFASGGIRDLPYGARTWTSRGDRSNPSTDLTVLPDGSILVLANSQVAETPFVSFRIEGGGPLPAPVPAGDLDGDGIPDAIELQSGRDMLIKDNDVFADTSLFAMQQYRDFLGREGDAGGISFWASQVGGGAMSRGQVIESFFNSAEFQGTIAPVSRLYFAYFLRVPDYQGLDFWIGYYRAGNSLEAISNFFSGSGEFQSTYGALDNTAFVNLVYQNVLGRAADPSGFAYWKGQLDSNAMTRGQVMLGFSESPEYRTASDSMIYVTMMYYGMLRRAPDQQGFDFWVGYRNQGNSGLALIDAFLGAQEYRSRFMP